MGDLLKRLLCQWFHAGGSIGRDNSGQINWRCVTCGRYSTAVTHKEEADVIDMHLSAFQRKDKTDGGTTMTDAPDPFYPPEVAEAWESGLRQGRMDARKVKPLVWERAELLSWGEFSDTLFGRYCMTWEYGTGPDGQDAFFTVRIDGVVCHSGWDEIKAKAAAQADRERRALSELVDL